MVLFGYLAALTKRIELVTGILILPQRQTVLVAKQAAEVDVLSAGRFRLGVGIGWNKVEYDALGSNFNDRGKRSEEQIALLRALFSGESVSFEGRWDHVDAAGINPLPVQRPIPIWIGGSSEAGSPSRRDDRRWLVPPGSRRERAPVGSRTRPLVRGGGGARPRLGSASKEGSTSQAPVRTTGRASRVLAHPECEPPAYRDNGGGF